MTPPAYGMTVRLEGVELSVAESSVRDALAKEGFGVLTEIDIQATFSKKLGVEVAPYRILGACNPTLAHQALQADAYIGLLLPCNVVLRSIEGATEVAFIDPAAMFQVVEGVDLSQVVEDVGARLRRVAASIQ